MICYFPVQAKYIQRWITNEDGLTNNSVNCIFEDSQKKLWIGTWNGLCMYDGRNIKTWNYDKDDSFSISNNIVYEILEEDSLHLWIITKNGVNRWDRRTNQFTYYIPGVFKKTSNPPFGAYSATILPNHIVLVLYKDHGIFQFDRERKNFKLIADLPFDAKQILAVSSHNCLYLVNGKGELWSYCLNGNTENKINFSSAHRIYSSGIQDISYSGNHFIVNTGKKLIVQGQNNKDKKEFVDLPEGKSIYRYCCSQTGVMLIACSDNSFYYYNLNTKQIQQAENIPNSLIFSLYAGSQNIFWIGTDGRGILQSYEYESPFHTINSNYTVRCFAKDDKGKVFVGTKGGGILMLNKKEEKLQPLYDQSNGLASNSVYCMRKNTYGDIFIGTDGYGINYLLRNSNKIEYLKLPPNTPIFKSVYSIVFTNNDSVMWLGTSGDGLIRINIERVGDNYQATSIYKYKASEKKGNLSYKTIYTMVYDGNKNVLWLGTRGGGVNRLNIAEGRFDNIEQLGNNLKLSDDDILVLSQGADDDLWIGTNYGLNRLLLGQKSYQIEEFTKSQGLADNVIRGILRDHNNNLWISTNRGLSFMNSKTNEITNYTIQNGLQNDEFSDGAYFKDMDNNLYFGGVEGLSWFNPDKIRMRNFSPDLSLTNISINNKNQNIYERIRANNTLYLSYKEAYVTLSFVVNDFINNKNCLFRYKIVGFANEWIQSENNNNIILTNLPAGKYRLDIQYTNGDRVWSNNTYTLFLKIAPPWWRSWIAYVVYLLIMLGVVFIIYKKIQNKIRKNQQKMMEQIKKLNEQKILESKFNFFTNIAHEFFTPITLIYGPAQQLLEKGDLDSYSKRYIQIIKNNADRMQKLLNELMEFRKIESGHRHFFAEEIDVKNLIDYITDNYTDIGRENRIQLNIKTQNLSTFVTDINSLEKIFFNLISNAFKYTPPAGYINIKTYLDINTGKLHFEIQNSGKGLTDKQLSKLFSRFQIFEKTMLSNSESTGVGLNLTKSLVELLGGKITVDSVLDEYVEFRLELPPMQMIKDKVADVKYSEDINNISILKKSSEKITILIVEDEKDIRGLLKDILSPFYIINEAENGEDALEQIAQNMPDVVISDILMPKVNGIELIDNLKSNIKTAHIPIINLSAKTSIEDHLEAYTHGADLYIAKPFQPKQILVAVENIINKRSLLKDYYNSSISSFTTKGGIEVHRDDESFLNEIIKYIEDNIDDESLNPNSISEFIGVSKASLYRKLKELTGKTPSELVRTIRLEHTTKLLKTTKLTVAEIMYQCGFSNKSYFYREFTKQYKCSPKEYRKEDK